MKVSLIISLLVMFFAVQVIRAEEEQSDTKPIPEKYKDEKEVALKIEGREIRDDSEIVFATFINPTKLSISYLGYSAQRPIYARQKLVDADWIDDKFGFCGVGVSEIVVPPGQSTRVAVRPTNSTTRYSIPYYVKESAVAKEHKTAWSGKIEPRTEKNDAAKGGK